MDAEIPPDLLAAWEERLEAWISLGEPTWLVALRQLHDQAFLVDWKEHLARLNARLKPSDPSQFSLPRADLPPAWFNGDVEHLVPGSWVLFVSLNPQVPGKEVVGVEPTPEGWWQFWLTHNTAHWYEKFFWRPVTVASIALGEEAIGDARPLFASRHMVFVEACPYASSSFPFDGPALARLATHDLGMLIERQVIELLLQAGPAAVLVNGNAAVEYFGDAYWPDRARWSDITYSSPTRPTRSLWYRQGTLTVPRRDVTREIPLVGFPFLGKPRTHNAHAEVADLGERIRALISG